MLIRFIAFFFWQNVSQKAHLLLCKQVWNLCHLVMPFHFCLIILCDGKRWVTVAMKEYSETRRKVSHREVSNLVEFHNHWNIGLDWGQPKSWSSLRSSAKSHDSCVIRPQPQLRRDTGRYLTQKKKVKLLKKRVQPFANIKWLLLWIITFSSHHYFCKECLPAAPGHRLDSFLFFT